MGVSDNLRGVPEEEQYNPADLPEPLRTTEGELSPQQEKAILALLHKPGLTAAAKEAGVGKTTLWQWMQQPRFKRAYREARREVFDATVGRLQQAATQAVETLCEVMADPFQQGAARVGAAKAVLDYAVKATEQEQIVERIEELERKAEDGYQRPAA